MRGISGFICACLRPILLFSLCLCASVVQPEAVEWSMHGALKNETAFFVAGEKRFDKMQNRLDIKPEVILSNRWQFRSRILTWYDAAMDIEPTNTTDLTPGIKKHYRTFLESKEAYLMYGGADFDLRIGQQQIVWGKTDGLRLLDIVNPLDLREFILDDFLDSRIGLWSVRLNYYADFGGSEHEFEFLAIPDARPAKLAPAGSRWSLRLPSPPAGIRIIPLAMEEPNWSPSNTEYGFAWRSNLAGWDVSLNYFYGWNEFPNIFRQLTGTTLLIQTRHLRMHTLGGSFANAFGPFVLRGEIAVNLGEGIDTPGLTFADSVVRRTTLNGALALDWTRSNWAIEVQVFERRIVNAPAENPGETLSFDFVTLRVATDFMNEKLKPEILILTDRDDGGLLFRPKVSYEFTDHWIGTMGGDFFTGSNGIFGQFTLNNRIYAEAEFSF